MKLSDAFEVEEEQASLEVLVKMININYGHNEALMKCCNKLEEYAFFIQQIRLNLQKGMPRKKAVDRAIIYCIEQGVMADFLKKHRYKARGNMLFEYDYDWHMYLEKRDSKNEGRAEGRAEAREEDLKVFVESGQEWHVTKDDMIRKLSEKYRLSVQDAEKVVLKYWKK